MKTDDNKKISVVVVLGHVDAGKSSILDHIQKTNIVAKESGGITQHVGVYESEVAGRPVTFIDTPGHAAFSSIRSRGAKIADLAVLVIAIDQGIQPQTKEAISYLKETGLPVIVVFNKSDLPTEKLNTVKGQLDKEGLTVESMGGSIPSLEISAKTGQGMEDLQEMIGLMIEMEEKSSPENGRVQGVIVESHRDAFRGPVATMIVQQGIFRSGDIIAAESACGRIKGLFNHQDEPLPQAGPGRAVTILGFGEVPKAGEAVTVCQTMDEAEAGLKKETFTPSVSADEDSYRIILKADVNSSLEAIRSILNGMPQEKVKIDIIGADTGNVSQNDVGSAQTAGAEIIGFNVGLNPGVRGLIDKAGIKFNNFEIIYKLTEYVEEALEKRRRPEAVRREVGKLEVLAIFKTEKSRQIIGGNVVSGQIEKKAKLDVFRGKEKIGQGRIITLECRKKEVEAVPKGQQAGILYEGTGRIQEGDLIEAYFIDMV